MISAPTENGKKVVGMAVREKLVELLDRFVYDEWYGNGDIAEKLISNGVTVQEWISVDDRLPEKDGDGNGNA